MTAEDYVAFLSRHALTHASAGGALGFTKATSSRYASGLLQIPLTVQLAIEAVEAPWRQPQRPTLGLRGRGAAPPPLPALSRKVAR